MRVVIDTPEVDEIISRRQKFGQDRRDETWDGVYHVAPEATAAHNLTVYRLLRVLESITDRAGLVATPAFNLGWAANYRVPDFGIHAELPRTTYVPTALLVGEVLSPHDGTYAKFSFYATQGVHEILVVDPSERTVTCYRQGIVMAFSDVLDHYIDELVAQMNWV